MIATVTLNPAVDQTLQVARPLEPDTVLRADDAQFDAGGKGINVSQYLDEMGTETVATGLLGGFVGRFVADELASAGIETAFVDVPDTTRMNTTVHADSEEYKLNQPGPQVAPTAVDAVVERLRAVGPTTVVVGGSLPPGLDSGAVDRLAQAGPWETVVDVDGPMLCDLDADYAWCKPNAPELEAATGRDIGRVEDAIRAARDLRATGFDRVVASLGGDGAILVDEGDAVHEPAIETDVVDTVGAGDALLSGVLAATEAGADSAAALQTGIVAATAAVSTRGTSVPSLPEPTADGVESV
jgi:1-phosphofructokinase